MPVTHYCGYSKLSIADGDLTVVEPPEEDWVTRLVTMITARQPHVAEFEVQIGAVLPNLLIISIMSM